MKLSKITPAIFGVVVFHFWTSIGLANIIGYDMSAFSASPVPSEAPATTAPSYVTANPVSRGAGMSASGLTHSFSTNNYPLSGSTLSDALSNDRYFEVSFGVSGSNVSFQSLDARIRKSASSAEFFTQWQYSLDAFSTSGVVFGGYDDSTIETDNGASQPTIDLSGISDLQNLSDGTVTMRMYVWGTPASSGTSFALGRSQELASAGGAYLGNALEISVVPEPRHFAVALGLLAFALVFVRRQRR